jgi:NADH-quinone oxidoreductase subunit J
MLFWILAIISVAAATSMIFMRKAVYSALLLAAVMLSLAALYASLEAPFLAFVQVIVYTGAVLMLFLFVIMLVGVSSTDSLVETIRGQRVWSFIAGLGFIGLLILGIGNTAFGTTVGLKDANGPKGNAYSLALEIFGKYVFAFEVTSALLITAALGAMVLAHKERTSPKATQRELSEQRFKSGVHPGNLPSSGTYARHNAVDMPALLPDGSASELSLNPYISRREQDVEVDRHPDLEGKTEIQAIEDDVEAVKEAQK